MASEQVMIFTVQSLVVLDAALVLVGSTSGAAIEVDWTWPMLGSEWSGQPTRGSAACSLRVWACVCWRAFLGRAEVSVDDSGTDGVGRGDTN